LELKTGLSTPQDFGAPAHRGQVMLYTLLLQEHFRRPVDWGLLFYTQNMQTIGVTAPRNLLVSLIISRNTIAYHLAHPTMPDLLREQHVCNWCSQLSLCMLMHKAREGGTVVTSGLGKLFTSNTDHLDAIELEWYSKVNLKKHLRKH
jgi:hypothetical protein